jgi:hypothetical protein
MAVQPESDWLCSDLVRGKMIYAHQLVCALTHGSRPSPKHDAAHSCGNGHQGCVNRRHLSWQTKSANQKDGWKKRGRQRYKLTPEQVAQIKAIKGLEPVLYTAARYDVNERTIRKIQSGEGWKLGTYAFRGKPIRCATSRTKQ